MAYYYNIQYSGGNIAVDLGKINAPQYYEPNASLRGGSNTTLQLVGRNYSNVTMTPDGTGNTVIYGYGSALNQNLVNMLQNFANTHTNLSNTQVYPNFIPGQLLFVTSNSASSKTNQLMLTTTSGAYGSATFAELVTAANPAASLANSNSTTSTTFAITTPAGPILANVDGVGNVMSISSTGVALGGTQVANLTVNGNITMSGARTFTGESANIRFMTNSNVAFSNVITVANGIVVSNAVGGFMNAALITGTFTTAANSQPNITELGNLTTNLRIGSGNIRMWNGGIDVYAGNIVVANAANGAGYMFKGDAGGISNIPGGEIVGNLPANVQIGFANMANYAGNITVNAQPNITSVGTLTSLSVSGNIIAGNVSGGNVVSANYLTGTLTTGAQPNITTLSEITITGNLQVTGNITSNANIKGVNGNFTTSVISPVGNITTVNSSNVNTDDINANTGNIDVLVSVDHTTTNVFATLGNITTINSTTINAGDINIDGTVDANYGNFAISVNSPIGNFAGGNVTAANGNFTTGIVSPIGNFTTRVITTSLTTGAAATNGGFTGAWTATTGSSIRILSAGSYLAVSNIIASTSAAATDPGSMTGAWSVNGTWSVNGNVSGGNINTAGAVVATGNVSGGNLTTAGLVNATGNVTGGNITTGGRVVATGNVTGGNLTTGGEVVATGNVTGGNIITGGVVNATGNVTGGNLVTTGTANVGTLRTSAITTGAAATAGSITGNWTLTAGSKFNATYADLAEYYVAPYNIPQGIVVEFGGPAEIQICDTPMSTKVAGVISTNPAFIMNENSGSNAQQIRELVALVGRVPCKVYGTCEKGDLMVSAGAGYAKAESNPVVGSVIGKSLEKKISPGVGVIEIVVGRV